MGTSADFGGPKGGEWTKYKMASANYVRYGGERQRRRLLNTFAKAVASGGGRGGGAAGGGGRGGRVGAGAIASGQAIAAFGATLANEGLDAALTEIGLAEFIGRDRFEVLGAILDALTGDGSTLDESHAKAALNEAMAEMFPDDAQDYGDLAAAAFDGDRFRTFVETFIGYYVYNEMALVLAKHLQKCDTVAEQNERSNDLREHISSLVTIETHGRDLLQIDWAAEDGRHVLDAVVDDLQSILEADE
jgi:hypothetical protein